MKSPANYRRINVEIQKSFFFCLNRRNAKLERFDYQQVSGFKAASKLQSSVDYCVDKPMYNETKMRIDYQF